MNLLRKLKKVNQFNLALSVLIIAGFLLIINAKVEDVISYADSQKPATPPEIVLFEGQDCDHCQKVDKFIKDNNIQEHVIFTRLEVFNDISNANALSQKARICGLGPSDIGVPFLWDGSHCILGDVDVIAFFKKKIVPR